MSTPSAPPAAPTFEEVFLDFAEVNGISKEAAKNFLNNFRDYVDYYFN